MDGLFRRLQPIMCGRFAELLQVRFVELLDN